jgi:YHS domain-containing protein
MRSVQRFPALVLAALFAAAVAGSGRQPPDPAAPKKAAVELALKGLDPVALTNGKEVPGDKAIALERGAFRYLFATDESRKQFERDPSRYEIQLKGECAAMPGVKGNPELFAVVKGRIYVFGSAACRAAFTAEPEKYFKPRKNVAIFVHQGVELLDFAGPGEVFAAADRGRAFNVYTVAAAEGDIVSQRFLTIKPRYLALRTSEFSGRGQWLTCAGARRSVSTFERPKPSSGETRRSSLR